MEQCLRRVRCTTKWSRGLARGAADAVVIRMFWQTQAWPIVDVPATIIAAYTPAATLHLGEVQVLALAQTLHDPLVLLDDEVARDEARRLGLRIRGTLGTLTQAYHQHLITLAQTEFLIQEIAARSDIWISSRLCEQVLTRLKSS